MNSILPGVFSNYMDFIWAIGYFGEYFTFIITCALIYNQYIYFIVFLIMTVVNRYFNTFIKNKIRQSRPENPIKFLDSDTFSKKKFGMPSGHTQSAFFNICYAYLLTTYFCPWIFLLLIIGAIIIAERLKYKNHTLVQLLGGALVGALVAYITVKVIKTVKLRRKGMQ